MASPSTVPGCLAARAATNADAVAVAVDGGCSLSFGEWDQRSSAVARALAARSVTGGAAVALVFDNRRWVEYAVAYLGVLKAGALAVPLAPRLSPLDLPRIIRHSRAAAVISPEDLAPRVAGPPCWTPFELEDGSTGGPPPLAATPDDVAERRYRLGALAEAWDRPFSHRQLMTRPSGWPDTSGAPLRHCAPVGTTAGQAALLAPLWGGPPSVATADLGGLTLSPIDAIDCDWTGPDDGALRVPISTAQVGMVWHEQFAPGSFSLAPLVRRYHGPLNAVAMQAALGEMAARHDSCRAHFAMVDGRSTTLVGEGGRLFPPIRDLSALAPDEAMAELGKLLGEARGRPFDLVDGPLWDPLLVRMAADDHVLIVRVHHSVFDDWSVGPFRRELSASYRALVSAAPDPLPSRPASFADFSRRQRDRLAGSAGDEERTFWRHELAGAPLSVHLPIDDPARPAGSPLPAAGPLRFEFSSELSAAIRDLARRQRATVFTVLLAIFGVLVERYCGQQDLIVSTLVANRNQTELEGVIGCFGKKILVRLDLSGDPGFDQLLARVRASLRRALAHPDSAYEAVLQEGLGARAARHGLTAQIGVKFQAEVVAAERLVLPGLTTSAVRPPGGDAARRHFLSREDAGEAPWGAGLYLGTFLGLSVTDGPGGLGLVAEGVFYPPAVQRLCRHFAELAEGVVKDPIVAVSALALDHDVSRAGPEPGPRLLDRAALPVGLEAVEAVEDGVRARVVVDRPPSGGLAEVRDGAGRVVPLGVHGELYLAAPSLAAPSLAAPSLAAPGLATRVLATTGQASPGLATPGLAAASSEREAPTESGVGTAGGERLNRTGWLARMLPGGDIELLATMENLTDLGGFVVDRSRIEAALADHPHVTRARLTTGTDASGQAQLVARVETAAGQRAPTPDELRIWLWTRIPGYAWPAEFDITGEPADASVDPALADLLTALWARVQGVDRVAVDDNYWQSFSFLEVLTVARAMGMALPNDRVLRNRTIRNLAIDVAAAKESSLRTTCP